MAAMSPGSPNVKLFINYRREDTAPYAGRLYDRLAAHFGADQVFIDIDQIEPGEDFVEVINRKVGACEIAIVSIGPNWLSVTDASGKRRLDAEEDFVRMEIIAALERKIRVIPVLVGGARMPRREDLPEALAPLSRRNAIELSETRFHADVNRLIEAVEKTCASPEQKAVPSVAATVSAAEQPPVKSAQTTLITTFIRNMLLNWPVLISWLGAAMMIPRLYLAAIIVSPNWSILTEPVQ
jgi:TIR domain